MSLLDESAGFVEDDEGRKIGGKKMPF